MYASRKLCLMICPLLLAPTWTRTALAQAVIAASQPAATLQADTSPATNPATQAAATAPAATEVAATTTAPAVAATEPQVVQPAPTTTAVYRPGAKFTLNFDNAPIKGVLDYLSQAAGFIVKEDATVEGRVTVKSKQEITPEEAVTLLNAVLKDNGYVLIQDGRILTVVTREKAKKSNLPVHFGADPAQIPVTEEMITQVIPVGSIDAVRLRTDLAPLLSADADVTANSGSNTIVITDTASNIHRVVEIIAAMDQHHTEVNDIKVFPLKYASASSAATLINNIFKTTTQNANNGAQGGPGGGLRALFGGGGGGFGGGGFGGGGFGGGGRGGGGGGTGTTGSPTDATFSGSPVQASSDDRTNTLVVSGPKATLVVVEKVVLELDSNPAETTSFFIYNLRNADAVNLQGVLNSFFGTGSGTSAASTTSNRTTGSSNSPLSSAFGSTGSSGIGGSSRGGSSSNGLGSFGSSSTNNTSNGNRITGGNTSSTGNRGGINASTAAAYSDMAGAVFVVAEPDTNALLVTTDAKYKDRVRAMLDELDRPVPQVVIKVLIAEVTHTDSSDIGVEWSVLDQRPSGKGESGGTDFGLAAAIANTTASGGPNGLIARVVEENLSAALKALASNGKLDVLSRPYILASDNQQASILVGQSVPFVTASNVTDTGTIINSVQYSPIGIELTVTPHINPDGLVIMDVNPSVSALTGQTVTIQAGVNAPVFDQRAAQSRVAIKDGQTIVIGGMMQDQLTKNTDKFPLLGDIPYLGALFSHTTTSKSKTELLIFLTPHVALQPAALKDMSRQEKEGTKLTPNAVGPGVYDEQMRGLDRGNTTQPMSPQGPVFEPPPPTTIPSRPPVIDLPGTPSPDVPPPPSEAPPG